MCIRDRTGTTEVEETVTYSVTAVVSSTSVVMTEVYVKVVVELSVAISVTSVTEFWCFVPLWKPPVEIGWKVSVVFAQ